MYITVKETTLSLLLILSILAYWNPFNLYMLSMSGMVFLGILVVVVALFAGLVIHDRVADEREIAHRDWSACWGYTAGTVTLVIALLLQAFRGVAPDPWLLVTLLIMILVKVGAKVYSRMKR